MASGHAGTFNISTGVETAVASLYAELQAAAGTSIEPLLAPLRTGELERRCMDPSRAREAFGWQAQTALADGLRSTHAALVAEFEADATDG
jgi:nucleoside-diphosphate-sugar epimerase